MTLTTIDRVYAHADYVRCRTFGHAWEEVPVMEADSSGQPQFWLQCTRCTTLRKDVVHRSSGELWGRHYDYPEEYRLAKGELPTRDEFRLRLLTLVEDLADRRSRRNAS